MWSVILHNWQILLFDTVVVLFFHSGVKGVVRGRGVLPRSGQLFCRGPGGAELHAPPRVVINHAVTLRLSGLSATLAAWGLGTSGDVWGRRWEGRVTMAHLSPRDRDQTCHLNLTSPTSPPSSLPPGSLKTPPGQKVYTLITWHITLWGTVNRGRQCLGAVHQWQ